MAFTIISNVRNVKQFGIYKWHSINVKNAI